MPIDYDVVSWALVTNTAGTGGTSLVVTTGHGARFANGAQYTKAVVYQLADPGVNERIAITNRSTDTFTIVRNIDGRGAQNLTASGWALRIDHDLVAVGVGTGQFAVYNTSAALTPMFVPAGLPANYWRAGDVLRHRAFYIFTNATGAPHVFNLTYYIGVAGSGIPIATIGFTVPAGVAWNIDFDLMIQCVSAAVQVAHWRYVGSGSGAPATTIGIAATARDTSAAAFNVISYCQIDASSASLQAEGFVGVTEIVRGQ
jgi:hypothetical protein